jgi:hypothetical protein
MFFDMNINSKILGIVVGTVLLAELCFLRFSKAPESATAEFTMTPVQVQKPKTTLLVSETPRHSMNSQVASFPPGISWHWQLSGLPIDFSIDAQVYDIDVFDIDADTVARLHSMGKKVICYLSAGSWEDWRPDAHLFPAEIIGKDYEGWKGEKWLDIRRIDLLSPILIARMDLCKAKGFDGIEPDNIDGFQNETGFPLSNKDQLKFNRWLSEEAHSRGLAIGLKNDPDQIINLEPYFDFAITEDCFADGWYTLLEPFSRAGKAILAAEYTDRDVNMERFCSEARTRGISLILKHRELDAWAMNCP